jgi:hypothetical protein
MTHNIKDISLQAVYVITCLALASGATCDRNWLGRRCACQEVFLQLVVIS